MLACTSRGKVLRCVSLLPSYGDGLLGRTLMTFCCCRCEESSDSALRLCQDPSAYPLDPSLLGLPAWHLAALASNRGAMRYLQGCVRWQVLLMYHATAAGWLLAGCWLHGRAGLAAYL